MDSPCSVAQRRLMSVVKHNEIADVGTGPRDPAKR